MPRLRLQKNFKNKFIVSFYQKYRVPILITTGVLTSFVVSFALDKIMANKIKRKLAKQSEDNSNKK